MRLVLFYATNSYSRFPIKKMVFSMPVSLSIIYIEGVHFILLLTNFPLDPHAGNLLACPDGRLCYLDFGMMSYAAANQRNGFLLAVVHIVNRDWPALVRLYRELGFIPQGTDLRPIEAALENALPDVLNADITELNFKNVINKLGDVRQLHCSVCTNTYTSHCSDCD